MWEGEGAKFESSGYYFYIEPPNLMLGVGIHIFSKDLLKAYREAVVNPESGPALVKAIQEVSLKKGYNLGGKHYKRVPRGYDPEHDNVEFCYTTASSLGMRSRSQKNFDQQIFSIIAIRNLWICIPSSIGCLS